jgi:hypothetical protein
MTDSDRPYGLLARFESAKALSEAVRHARAAGYADVDAYSPIPLPELPPALGERGRGVLAAALVLGLISAAFWYALQDYSLYDYPFVSGGKPFHAWPPFMVVAFEMGVLAAVLIALIAMLMLNGLPALYHPLFNVDAFAERASDSYFLCIRASDARFDRNATREFLLGEAAVDIAEVPE